MSALPVARSEFRRLLRGKTPWLIGLLTVILSRVPTPPSPAVAGVLGGATPLANSQVAVALIVPLAAAVLGFRALIGERESGTIRILAGTTVSRTELVLGKFLGRTVALYSPVVIATVLVVGFDSLQFGAVSWPKLAGYLAIILLYVIACVGVVVALSTVAKTTTRAAITVFGFATLGALVWSDVSAPLLWQLFTGSPPGNNMQYADVYQFLNQLSVTNAYYVLTNWVFGAPTGPSSAVLQVSDAIRSETTGGNIQSAYAIWVAVLTVVAWPVLSLFGGIAAFRRGDVATSIGSGLVGTLWSRLPTVPSVSLGPLASPVGRGGVIDRLPGQWQALARREFSRFARSPGVWVVGLLVIIAGVLALPPGQTPRQQLVRETLGPLLPIAAIQNPVRLFGGIGVLFGTFRAVVTERDTGSIRNTAGTAASRTNILVGILIGRATAFALPVVLAIVIVCLVAVPRYGLVPIIPFFGFLLVTVMYVFVLAGVGVGVSALTHRQTVAGAFVLGLATLSIGWKAVVNIVYNEATGLSVSGFNPPTDPYYFLLDWLLPHRLFNVATNAILDVANSGGIASVVIQVYQSPIVTEGGTVNFSANTAIVNSVFGEAVPVWFLHPAIGLVGLALWFAIPFGAALIRLRSGDLV